MTLFVHEDRVAGGGPTPEFAGNAYPESGKSCLARDWCRVVLKTILTDFGDGSGARIQAISAAIARCSIAMKISGPAPISPTPARRSKGVRSAKETEFAAEVGDEPNAASAVIPGTAVGAIEGILAVQEVSEETGGRSRSVARGHNILDRLDEIRHGLLMGSIPRERLVGLREQVQARRETVTDERLAAILEEIDLRAAVELAKLGIIK